MVRRSEYAGPTRFSVRPDRRFLSTGRIRLPVRADRLLATRIHIQRALTRGESGCIDTAYDRGDAVAGVPRGRAPRVLHRHGRGAAHVAALGVQPGGAA